MFKLWTKFIVFAIGLVFLSTVSNAKFKGPDETPHYHTVHEVLTKPVDGEEVKLSGRVIAKIGEKRYLFVDTDGTGEVPVVISKIILILHKDFTPNNVVTITAKINIKLSGPELIVSSLDIV